MSPLNLVIVESPAKCKIIAKYLNSSAILKKYGTFVVVASMGHIRNLPKKELGIDIPKDFKVIYVVTDDKKKVVEDLVKKRKQASFVWLATDADLEGAAISNSIKEELKLKKNEYKRITFTEITQKALENAIMNASDIDYKKVEAQETRRVLDRLVGFKLSPLLWKRYKGIIGLSAGRVQSAALAIIVNKEKDIESFDSQSYWYIQGNFTVKDTSPSIHKLEDLKLHNSGDGGKVYKSEDKKVVEKLLKTTSNKFYVADTKSRLVKQNPDLPFITSTLQQEANSKHGFTIKRTMQLAQELYENGFITYMRTDSYTLSDDFKDQATKYVIQEYGAEYLGLSEDKKKPKKNQSAQEAHEAIRPTNVKTKDIDLGVDHRKLYEMIWRRTVAYFMKAAIFDELEMKITENEYLNKNGLYFVATFKKCKFNGYLEVYDIKSEKYNFEHLLKKADTFKVTCEFMMGKNTWSNPPARYNESSLVKVLESEGIGRPSTYASILTKLYDKQYILKTDVNGVERPVIHMKIVPGKASSFNEIKDNIVTGAERTRLVPTEIGKTILEFLKDRFEYILDRNFTAHMEADLDRIENGEKSKLEILNAFWKQFGADVAIEEKIKVPKETLKGEERELVVDGVSYKVRLARYGPVIQKEKEYIGLKPYLKYHRKEYMDITEEDIKLLTSMPRNIGTHNGDIVTLVYGPYGFYVKYKNENIRLTNKLVQQVAKENHVDIKDVVGCIEYHKNKGKDTGKDSSGTKTKKTFNNNTTEKKIKITKASKTSKISKK